MEKAPLEQIPGGGGVEVTGVGAGIFGPPPLSKNRERGVRTRGGGVYFANRWVRIGELGLGQGGRTNLTAKKSGP